MFAMLHAFDQSIFRPGDRAQRRSQVLDRLMMVGIDAQFTRAQLPREQRLGIDPRGVREPPPRMGLLVAHGTRALRRDVLIQRAAQVDIEELAPAADREQRDSARRGGVQRSKLDFVPRRVHRTQLRKRRLPIQGRCDVIAPGENETIAPAGQ